MSEAQRKRRLIIEFELPDFYCDDLPELLSEYGDPDQDRGEAILHEIGDVNFGALIIEVSGEKDSDIVTVPVLARTARIEDELPSEVEWLDEAIERLTQHALERAGEKAYHQGYDDGLKDGAKKARRALEPEGEDA